MGGVVLCLDKSAIILAVGMQGGFTEDKGLLKLENKPLLEYVFDAVEGFVDEIIVVTGSQEQADGYAEFTSSNVRFVVEASGGLLDAAIAGFGAAEGKYSLLLPFDAPFVSGDVILLLFDCCIGKSAVIPRTPDCEAETMQAVYDTKRALEAAKKALEADQASLEGMICKLKGVRYMSTMVIEQLDPDMRTFFTVNTPLDLKKAAVMLKPKKHR
jgi:molybdopterin-guanine dinucleotide biosynthesis protein A